MKDNRDNQSILVTRREAIVSAASVIATSLLAFGSRPARAGVLGRGSIDRLLSPSRGLLRYDNGSTWALQTNLLPDHPTGTFPNPACPVPISATNVTFQVAKTPAQPSATPQASASNSLNMWLLGIFVNGVACDTSGPYYNADPSTGWQFEVASSLARQHLGLDFTNCHSQPGGPGQATNVYHCHAFYSALWDEIVREIRRRGGQLAQVGTQPDGSTPIFAPSKMVRVGFAADGFPIYAPFIHSTPGDWTSPMRLVRSSYALAASRPAGGPSAALFPLGTFVQDYVYQPGSGDLDGFNGLMNVVTPEYPNGTYAYFMTYEFPYTSRHYVGTPDQSFQHGPPPGVSAPLPPELRGPSL